MLGAGRSDEKTGSTYHTFEVATAASANTTVDEEQIRDQITPASPLPDGGVALQLAFVVGPRRAWPNLWKATIRRARPDPRTRRRRPHMEHPGRITDLGLHHTIAPNAGNDVTIAIRASPAGTIPAV